MAHLSLRHQDTISSTRVLHPRLVRTLRGSDLDFIPLSPNADAHQVSSALQIQHRGRLKHKRGLFDVSVTSLHSIPPTPPLCFRTPGPHGSIWISSYSDKVRKVARAIGDGSDLHATIAETGFLVFDVSAGLRCRSWNLAVLYSTSFVNSLQGSGRGV